MQILCAADKAHRSHTVSVGLQAVHSRLNYLRVICQSEIIIGAKIQDRATIHQNIRALWPQDAPLGLVEAFRTDVGKLLFKNFFKGCVRHIVGTVDKLTGDQADRCIR
jgi:hypothetical protein